MKIGEGKREFRIQTNVTFRASKDGDSLTIEGYAAVFDEPTDLGWFREVIKPGSFTRTLKEGADVRCLMNHDPNLVLGRSTNKTLELEEDNKGLRFRCTLPDTQAARDLHTLIDRGDVDQCSFGFVVRKANWVEENDQTDLREILDVDLWDVSAVTFPAYPTTSVSARTLFPDGMPEEVEKRAKRDDKCECDCPECQDGNCADCSMESCNDSNCQHNRSAVTPSERDRMHMRLELLKRSSTGGIQ